MNTFPDDTAIIFFSYSAKKEAEVKRFSLNKNRRYNQHICNELIKKTTNTLKGTGLPFYIVDEKLQRGNNFGEKCTNAILDYFDKGYKRLIMVGNDCLQLSGEEILEAYTHLQNGENIAGPTDKGGLYLMGVNKTSFDCNAFKNIRWQTPFVYEDFVQSGKIYLLTTLSDANSEYELLQQLDLLGKQDAFTKIIISFLSSFTGFTSFKRIFFRSALLTFTAGLRAPPLC